MLNIIALAAAALIGWLGHSWLWILPLALLATVLTLVYPSQRLASLRMRGAFMQVFFGALPIQAAFVALFWLAGHFLHGMI